MYETPFLLVDDYDSVDDLDLAETLEDSFDLLVNDTQTIISSEKESLNEFFEDGNEEIENFKPLYPIAPEMTFTNWKKLDE